MSDPADIAAFRFGYGLPLPSAVTFTAEAMLAQLAGPDHMAQLWPGYGLREVLPQHHQTVVARQNARLGDAERALYREALRAAENMVQGATRASFVRALDAADGFRERLVRFWADHFTTVGRFKQDRILPFALIEDAIRPHLAGRFSDMLMAATLHPAMLVYLDQVLSVGPNSPEGKRRRRGLNENLARELIELHTLGVGAGYKQRDVQQLAELLTGLSFEPGVGQIFLPDLAEPGAESILGKTYGAEGMEPVREVLMDLALRPVTGRHIAKKLAVHFLSDSPDPAVVAAMARAFNTSGGDLLAVYAVMLDAGLSQGAPLQKARQPFDFMVASLRALGMTGEGLMRVSDGNLRRYLVGPLKTMGQDWDGPIGPNGWPEEAAAWITPQGLAGRIAWAVDVPDKVFDALPDPRDLAQRALGSLASERLLWAVAGAENLREGVGLVLASPEFNRR